MNRILLLESLPTISGGQRVLLDLAPALLKRFDVAGVVPSEGPLGEALRTCGVSVTLLPMTSYTLVKKGWRDVINFITDTPRLTLALTRLIRNQNSQLVYINNSRAFVWGTLGAWVSGRPAIWHAHNVLADRKSLMLVSLLAGMHTVRKIVCPSNAAAAQYARQRDKVIVLPSGIDLEHYAPLPRARAAKRSEFGFVEDNLVIGIVGDLIPLKGQDVFVQASIQVAAKFPEAAFLIVGDARPTKESRRYRLDLETSARHAQAKIRFVGFQSDIAAVLNALDILVIASTTETGPLVLLEALACGVPVISTPVGMAVDLLNNELCGTFFPINDSAALAGKLVELMSRPDRRRRMAAAARQHAVEHFDLRQFRARLTAIVEQAIC